MPATTTAQPASGAANRVWRSRWAAVGAAVAVSLGAGGIYITNAASSSDSSSFVAITPVRVLDTRSNLGLTGAFTSLTSRDLQITGNIATTDGNQTVVPTGATAVALNVTVVSPTAQGFLSVRPADATGAPSTSSLNFTAGQVVPNAVTVQIPTSGADTGKIELTYNAFELIGPTTHLLVDIVGYYQSAELPADGTACVADGLPGTVIKGSDGDGDYTLKCFRGLVTTLAGDTDGGTTEGAPAKFNSPYGVGVDKAGNVYVADFSNNRIRKMTPAGIVTTLAGSTLGFSDDTGINAQFNLPTGVAVDAAGNVYVADRGNHKIRKVTPAGVTTTLAGSTSGFADDTGTSAQFDDPTGVAVDSAGNVYVADKDNHKIRKITSAGVTTTLAGSTSGFADDTGTSAQFNGPTGVAVDSAGNVYVADRGNHKIRKITPAGVVTTLAGSTFGTSDGTGGAAQFAGPAALAVDAGGTIYVVDELSDRVRKLTAAGEVTTIAGSSVGFLDGAGTASQFSEPLGIAVDTAGNIYVADTSNNRIRKIN